MIYLTQSNEFPLLFSLFFVAVYSSTSWLTNRYLLIKTVEFFVFSKHISKCTKTSVITKQSISVSTVMKTFLYLGDACYL